MIKGLLMRNIFISFFILCVSSYARENPFFPAEGEVDIPLSSNQVKYLPKLKRAAIELPSYARSIESITIKYKSLDGSIKEKTEVLKNSIDWHIPIFVSQNINNTKDNKYTNTTSKVAKTKTNFTKLLSLRYISLYENANLLKIVTKDKMMRNFGLVEPHRIVFDFQRDIDIRSYESDINPNSYFRSVRVGNHRGYYRVVVTLDGEYVYKLNKTSDGYIIKLK
jgi:hypothetical protein